MVPVRPVIVSVGEILWDRFPKEAQLSGAPTNVAIHAAALGAESWLVSAVGNDSLGNMALSRLDAAGVYRDTVPQLLSRPTGTVLMKLDAKGAMKYDFAEDVAWDHLAWSPRTEQVVKRAEALTFGTLAQRSQTSRDTVRHAAGATSPRAWRLFDVNLRQNYYDSETIRTSLTLANAVKLNERELPEVARRTGVRGAAAVADPLGRGLLAAGGRRGLRRLGRGVHRSATRGTARGPVARPGGHEGVCARGLCAIAAAGDAGDPAGVPVASRLQRQQPYHAPAMLRAA